MGDLRFTKTHEWVKKIAGNEYVAGITAHAAQLLGDIVFVELPNIGVEVKAGNELAVVESVKAAADVYAPIAGKITANNQALVADPYLINKDCYEQGWLVKIAASDLSDLENLLDNQQYQNLIEKDS